GKGLQSKYSNFILLPPPVQNQKVILDVVFDCKGRIDGHWRDTRYCDVFHACLAGEQKRSYGCKQDGFYASRWCNVFYRCFTGIATSFLCPKMPSGSRLWWVQHGSPQSIAQETAACTWPCETSRRCSSPGGIVVDSSSTVTESQQEAETVFTQSLCTSASDGSI
ncbi:unnamed protein product, partial [Rotaria magnacalcarata]